MPATTIIKDPKIKLDEFEEIPAISVKASELVTNAYIRLGRPQDPFTPSGEKMMNIIIAVWEDLYPRQRIAWEADRADYKRAELSISEQVSKKTGRSLASYPYPIYLMMKKIFPKFNAIDRKNCMRMVKKWPMFRFANKI